MPQDSYPYAVGRVRVLESRLIDKGRWARLKEAEEADALRILTEAGYGAGANAQGDVENLIQAELAATRALIDEITPDERLTDLFLLRTDAHNIKTLLKARLIKADCSYLLVKGGTIDLEALALAIDEGEFKGIPKEFAKAIELSLAETEKGGDPRVISSHVDKAVFAHALSVLRRRKSEIIEGYFRAQIDFLNVLSAVRARNLGWDESKLRPLVIPGGEIAEDALADAVTCPVEQVGKRLAKGRFASVIAAALDDYREGTSAQSIERRMDAALMDVVRAGKFDSFSMGPIVGYLLGREAEAKALRVLFTAKKAGVTPVLPELYA